MDDKIVSPFRTTRGNLLALLQHNGKMTAKELAQKIGVCRTQIYHDAKWLMKEKIISEKATEIDHQLTRVYEIADGVEFKFGEDVVKVKGK